MDTLIDRYLAAVSDLLPANLRAETIPKIRAQINEALDERIKTEGHPADDQLISDVLKQLGPPEKIVASYLPPRYLIGPQLFPTFMLVLRIALPIIGILSLVGYFASHNQVSAYTWDQLFTNIFTGLGTVLTAVLTAFGNIVLIFAILQWAVPGFKLPAKEKVWDPRSLKAISHPDRIMRGELIVEIVFTLVFLIVFTFYLNRVGIYNYVNGQWVMTPILTSAFNAYIPWFILIWVLTIILDVILLQKGSWSIGSRVFSILLSGMSIALAASLIVNLPSLYTLEAAFSQYGVADTLQSLLNGVLIFIFSIVIIANSVKIIQQIIRLFKSKPLNVER